jgi:periplasmic protein TonB
MSMRGVDFIGGIPDEALQPGAMPSPQSSEIESPPRASFSIWFVAALGAVLIHAGCAVLAFEYLQSDEVSEDLGAPAIEVGIELMAPRLDQSNLPPGPEAEASAASPAVMQQQAVVEQTEVPKAMPTETDDPDRVVAPEEMKKPNDDDPKEATVQTAPSNPSIAAEATAMPSPETAQEAPRSVAPELGTAESLRRVRATWQKELAAHLDKYKRYPADRSRQSAEIVIRFALDRTGHVVSASIAKSGGDSAFDDAALAMMRRADPVPPPPPSIADEGLSFTMPVIFRVKPRTELN